MTRANRLDTLLSMGRSPGANGERVKRQARYRAISSGPRTKQTTDLILKEFASLGAPPEDPLETQVWAYNAVAASMMHVINDPELGEKERRAEMRQTARVLRELMPMKRLKEAEDRVKGETSKALGMEGGPELHAAPPIVQKSRRGRPPKKA